MSIILSFGDNGGLYFHQGASSVRLCLWRVALTVLFFDVDIVLTDWSRRVRAEQP